MEGAISFFQTLRPEGLFLRFSRDAPIVVPHPPMAGGFPHGGPREASSSWLFPKELGAKPPSDEYDFGGIVRLGELIIPWFAVSAVRGINTFLVV